MLQIANRRFHLHTPSSCISVRLAPTATDYNRHRWSMSACFVPDDDDSAHPPWHATEMWRLGIPQISGLQVRHWHELERFEVEEEEDLGIHSLGSSLQNIVRYGVAENPVLSLDFGTFRFIRREGYLFTLEASGEVLPQRDSSGEELCGDFTLLVQIPFHQVSIAAPLNTTDPLATAAGIARREISLTAHARSQVQRFDPSKPVWKPVENSHHTVLLETPWRA